jgi:Domain of unknown function (DUF4328)
MSAKVAGRSFRRSDGLGRVLRALLAVGIIVDVVSILVTFLEVQTLERLRRGEASPQEAVDAIDRSGVVGIVVGAVYLGTIVIWLVWQHRGQANLHALAIPRLTYSPGWAVGWWLIPVANLWKPFQTVRELWKASGGDEAWWRIATWPVIGWWWACWIIFNLLYNATTRFWSSDSASLERLIAGDGFSIAGDLVSIVGAILAVSIVRSVTERQAGIVQLVADRIPVPARPDLPSGGVEQNP